jgi:hypothetical protein
MVPSGERTGVLVLTAWLEQRGAPLRVRISERVDVRSTEERSVLVAGAESAAGTVRDWLIRFENQEESP